MNNTTLVLITLTALLLTQIIGIPTWHYATALLINAAWRHRHTKLLEPLTFTTPAPRTTSPTLN